MVPSTLQLYAAEPAMTLGMSVSEPLDQNAALFVDVSTPTTTWPFLDNAFAVNVDGRKVTLAVWAAAVSAQTQRDTVAASLETADIQRIFGLALARL